MFAVNTSMTAFTVVYEIQMGFFLVELDFIYIFNS
jgi:hypothetical protein